MPTQRGRRPVDAHGTVRRRRLASVHPIPSVGLSGGGSLPAPRPFVSLTLPHHAEHHNSVPTTRAAIREGTPGPVERGEVGGVARVLGGFGRVQHVRL